ncbi:transcription factor HES-7.1-A-like [Arapaima gigas]
MKPLGAGLSGDLKAARKLLKPQVERHRRERMNRSLETLKILLFQGLQCQGQTSRRIEKAEILEHAVFFLKNCDQARTGEHREAKHIQDGFSACLQRASRFLHSRGESKQAQTNLDAKASHQPKGVEAWAQSVVTDHSFHNRVSSPSVQFRHQMPGCRNCGIFHHRDPVAQGGSSIPHHVDRKVAISCFPTTKTSQTVWRPWP